MTLQRTPQRFRGFRGLFIASPVTDVPDGWITRTLGRGIHPWAVYTDAAVTLLKQLEESVLTALLPRWRCDVPCL